MKGFLPFSKGQVPPAKTCDVTAVFGTHVWAELGNSPRLYTNQRRLAF